LQNGYVRDIQQSIIVLNCTPSLILKAKEKLHFELQRIVASQSDDYDPQCVNNALDIELDIFHNTLDLNALRKVMLKGDVGIYRYNRSHATFRLYSQYFQQRFIIHVTHVFSRRHAVCCLDKASVAAINPQCTRIKSHFPMMQMPIYTLMECYRNVIANIIYRKLHGSTSMESIEHVDKLASSRDKCNYNSLELLSLSKVVCDQAREEIGCFNVILNSW